MEYGVLVDVTKCIGCRGCQVSCKRWNSLSGEMTLLSGDWTNPPKLSHDTYTHMRFNLDYEETSDTYEWRFLNWRCMHCKNLSCLEACPVNAIERQKPGGKR